MALLLRVLSALILTVLLVLILVVRRSDLEPVVWTPPPNPGLTGQFATNRRLTGVKTLLPGVGMGPEDVALGPDGALYTGFEDGRIVRVTDNQHRLVADTGGRPLGLQFDHQGQLIVADGELGLLSVAMNGDVTLLANQVDGVPMKLVDDLDIAADGTIWFSDASQRFGLEQAVEDLLEASATGRLLSYSPTTGEVAVHLEGLYFANGVALGPGDRFVLVSETGPGRIRRLWLQGEQVGHSDVFVDALPGHLDNLSFNGKDTFWVAVPGLRAPILDAMAAWPTLRKLVGALPKRYILPPEGGIGCVLGFDLEGNLRYNLQDPRGAYHTITSVNEWGGQLYLGSLNMDAMGVLQRP